MSSYETEFYWFGPANQVNLTGSFDNWSQSVHMEKTPAGFSAKVKLPYGQKVDYKYVVDGQWHVNPDFPTTYDWQGNINNYIVTPNEPEPVPELPKSLPTPPPDLVIKPPTSPANDGPVTPIALPAPAAAVTPMEVPQSSVSPHPDLEVDPVEEKSEQIAQAAAAEEPKVEVSVIEEPRAEAPVEAQAAEEPTVEEAKPAETEAEELAPPPVLSDALVASPSPMSATQAAEASMPVNDDVKPEAAQPEPVALDSPVKPSAPSLPEVKPAAAPEITYAPAAVPLPETPAATPAIEKQAESTTSHFSTTTSDTKPDAPVTPTKKSEDRPGSVKRGSTRSSRMFSLSGRRTSQDSAGDMGTLKGPKSPGTPGSETGRKKKKSSFISKVHDLFHPHQKEGKA